MIRLLSAPLVDYTALRGSRSLIKKFGYKEPEPAAFLLALQSMKFPGITPSRAIRQPLNSATSLLFFTFVADEPVGDFLQESGIHAFVVDDNITVMGGTLTQWRDAVVAAAHANVSECGRKVAEAIYTEFQHLKLSEIWYQYRRIKGAFILEYRG